MHFGFGERGDPVLPLGTSGPWELPALQEASALSPGTPMPPATGRLFSLRQAQNSCCDTRKTGVPPSAAAPWGCLRLFLPRGLGISIN